MKTLLVADLHLDDKHENKYRWNIIDQIQDLIPDKEIDRLIILGDLTEKKNRHDARLVHEIVYQLNKLSKSLKALDILIGNHDYVDQDSPFFSFLDNANDYKEISVTYGQPYSQEVEEIKEIFLPHVRNTTELYHNIDLSSYDVCFTHLDVKGHTRENGTRSLEGLPTSFFKNVLTFSGHIHVGQTLGKTFHYVGSPYSVIYEREDILHRGIILEYDSGKIQYEDVYFDFPRRIKKKVKSLDDVKDFKQGDDFYKFDVVVKESELDKYVEISQELKESNIILRPVIEVTNKSKKVSDNDTKGKKKDFFKSHCISNELSKEITEIGKELIKNVSES